MTVACTDRRGAPASPPPHGAAAAKSARSRIDTFRLTMPELDNQQRTIRVYLPSAYTRGGHRFPVLYLQDGQQLFSPGPFGDWRVDETLDSLSAAGALAGLIVVGVDNGPRRWDEYGPWPNAHMHDWIDPSWSRATEGGQGDAYLRFLTNTLKPEIDRRYPTRPGREHTGIGGSSMGGLIALYAALTRPDVYSKVMAMSTAVWFAEGGGSWLSSNRLLASLRSGGGVRPVPRDVRFYLDVGTNESSRDHDPDVRDAAGRRVGYSQAYVEGSRAVADSLRARGVADTNLRFVVDSGAVHHETAWSRRFPRAVQWLYEGDST